MGSTQNFVHGIPRDKVMCIPWYLFCDSS